MVSAPALTGFGRVGVYTRGLGSLQGLGRVGVYARPQAIAARRLHGLGVVNVNGQDMSSWSIDPLTGMAVDPSSGEEYDPVSGEDSGYSQTSAAANVTSQLTTPASPATTVTSAATTSPSLLTTLTQAITGGAAAATAIYNTQDLQNINATRAAQGLPPLNQYGQVAPAITSAGTAVLGAVSPLILVLIGGGLLFMLARK